MLIPGLCCSRPPEPPQLPALPGFCSADDVSQVLLAWGGEICSVLGSARNIRQGNAINQCLFRILFCVGLVEQLSMPSASTLVSARIIAACICTSYPAQCALSCRACLICSCWQDLVIAQPAVVAVACSSWCSCGACDSDIGSNWCRINSTSGAGFCDSKWGSRHGQDRLSYRTEGTNCVHSSSGKREDFDCCCLGAGGAVGCRGVMANSTCPPL